MECSNIIDVPGPILSSEGTKIRIRVGRAKLSMLSRGFLAEKFKFQNFCLTGLIRKTPFRAWSRGAITTPVPARFLVSGSLGGFACSPGRPFSMLSCSCDPSLPTWISTRQLEASAAGQGERCISRSAPFSSQKCRCFVVPGYCSPNLSVRSAAAKVLPSQRDNIPPDGETSFTACITTMTTIYMTPTWNNKIYNYPPRVENTKDTCLRDQMAWYVKRQADERIGHPAH